MIKWYKKRYEVEQVNAESCISNTSFVNSKLRIACYHQNINEVLEEIRIPLGDLSFSLCLLSYILFPSLYSTWQRMLII